MVFCWLYCFRLLWTSGEQGPWRNSSVCSVMLCNVLLHVVAMIRHDNVLRQNEPPFL